ncbi:hypothetical protein HK100_009218 [Physocladia obscura]|uniref:BZIP domain-containing protein n=1 Tax=Physocladia obscura TaxID=109957 RepID=A0AAD5T416_9FUNG|nr:hypothetical protein HK100_009218 [Physocladia obscura]
MEEVGDDLRYNPRSNRGRRRQVGESTSYRNQQMRDAQRALRARKQQYLLDLEAKNKELQLENIALKQQIQNQLNDSLSIPVPPTTDTYFSPDIPCLNPRCVAKILEMQTQISKLNSQISPPVSTVGNPEQVTNLQNEVSLDWLLGNTATDSSASQFEVPHSENNGNGTIQLENIVDNTSFFDRIWNFGGNNSASFLPIQENLSRSAEECFGPVQIEPYKSMIKALPSIKDSKVVDRAFDLMVAEYGRKQCAPPDFSKTKIESDFISFAPHRAAAYCEALKKIPSLDASHHEIDALSTVLIGYKEFDLEGFFRFQLQSHALLTKCNSEEDAVKFWAAVEHIRHPKDEELDELLAGIEAVTI